MDVAIRSYPYSNNQLPIQVTVHQDSFKEEHLLKEVSNQVQSIVLPNILDMFSALVIPHT